MALVRLASVPGKTFFRLGAPPYVIGDVAVTVGQQFPAWPNIIDVATIDAGDLGAAQYLWYQPGVDPALVDTGETVFFARETTLGITALLAALTVPIKVKIFADNAFQARMTISPDVGTPLVFDFTNGPISQATVQTNPPFGWQNVYEFSAPVTLAIGVITVGIEFEAKVVNYAQPGGTPETNTAGLMYSILLDNFLVAPTVTEVQPPTITNPLA
ncbi:hypothetical protein SY88_22380 [Clostridiales bacterium PH28_bin88]|nr:hypothetical protein SY88_22380 [Clostridiales bacterium PH28_bin88]